MPKKNGFIAISIIYSFFLCFIMLMMGMLANYTHSKLILRKTNEPLIFEQDSHLTAKIMQKYPSRKTISDFSQGCPTSSDNSCSGLFQTVDDDGDSYYFRGAIDNNYLKLSSSNSNLWRIVRINGDGTIRLILDGDIGTSAFNTNYNERKSAGYTYDNQTLCTNSNPCEHFTIQGSEFGGFLSDPTKHSSDIKTYLETWYQKNLSAYDSQIELEVYCNDTSYGRGSETSGDLYYGAYQRLHGTSNSVKPQLTCPDPKAKDGATSEDIKDGYHTYGGVYKLKIGLLSGDEMNLAGLSWNLPHAISTNYLYKANNWWSMSPFDYFSSADVLSGYPGFFLNDGADNIYDVIPVINLKTGTQISSGDGSSGNPFVIKTN